MSFVSFMRLAPCFVKWQKQRGCKVTLGHCVAAVAENHINYFIHERAGCPVAVDDDVIPGQH